MSTITYRESPGFAVKVYSGGLRVGTIKAVNGGWRYFPKGLSVGGEIFQSISAVKNDIEGQ